MQERQRTWYHNTYHWHLIISHICGCLKLMGARIGKWIKSAAPTTYNWFECWDPHQIWVEFFMLVQIPTQGFFDLFPSIVTILTYKSIIIWPEQPSWENKKKKTLCTRAKWDGENWAWKSTMPKCSCELKIEGKKKERAVITWWMHVVRSGRTGKYWTIDMTSN